jgi:hypothetical protein
MAVAVRGLAQDGVLPPTTGRGFHPTLKARRLCDLRLDYIAACDLPTTPAGHSADMGSRTAGLHMFTVWGMLWPT